ncbi:DUF3152 domain-containing protein [Streptomyces sp. AM8-1-1]|uniref:DUF3152 domain-containing protein n=1 Tax=Streptomyces sp. AM8-1-1 TaxID=3075825 RepID=UPI0028C40C4D|nr:DUF3152 domain-containing protein [Streptomyces sp. AM8-1-1]WNO72461.1 DUF3152 domain-containing protein [Streptomyces sp. AM8-1-1]
MGRHSRKGPAPKGSGPDRGSGAYDSGAYDTGELEPVPSGPGGGRRRRSLSGTDHAPAGHGSAQTRGGHPEQREAGGGWGGPQDYGTRQGAAGAQRPQSFPRTATAARIPGPRRDFVEAFDEPQHGGSQDAYASVTTWGDAYDQDTGAGPVDAGTPDEERPKGGKGRTFTGIAAAAVTTVLAVVVAGQVASDGSDKAGAAASGEQRDDDGPASRSQNRQLPPPAEQAKPAAPVTYAQLMATQFQMDPKLTADGSFEAVPGLQKAPGKGRKIRYRVDIEKGLGLDGALFAGAVQRTLNDKRSWAHGGAMTFERISSGKPDFVITLASPGTTDVWCAKSDLDTSVDNVSCDSASTERVMINAYRWAQGSSTYGAKAMFPYRQMLINHEVGHRLGHGHVNCRTAGELAPVMQQQTKSLNVDGVKCRPNPWVHPGG